MATICTKSNLTTMTPPPSPIPTGKGSRSAANEILAEYLEKSLQIPDLTLPDSHFPAGTRRPIPSEIDFRSIVSRDFDSINRMMKSAKDFGAFRIIAHGISDDELVGIEKEAERVFGNLAESRVEWARESSGEFENVASKLEGIGEEVGRVFSENAEKRLRKRIQETETVFSLYRHNGEEQKQPFSVEKCNEFSDHALSLHLPLQKSEIYIQYGKLHSSFDAGPEIILVTVGKILEEWSLGEIKCASGEILVQPLHGSQCSFSIELKCSPSNLNSSFNKNKKKISIADQFLIVLIIAFLYKIFVYIFS